MAKMLALTKILMPDDTLVSKGSVFTCTPAQAKQFDSLNAARPATEAEITAAAAAAAIADGSAFNEPELPLEGKSASGAPGDPHGAPKGK